MNILLWVFQILLALHTAMGAMWKFTNSEQTVPSLGVIPHEVWMGMIGIELLCSLGLVLPAFYKRSAIAAPISAAVIGAEMLLFCGLHLSSGEQNHGEVFYWLVVAAFCAFIAVGRLVLKPIR